MSEGFVLLAGLLVALLAPLSDVAVPDVAAPVVPMEADPGPVLALPAPQWSEISVTLLTWKVFCPPEELAALELVPLWLAVSALGLDPGALCPAAL
jgi:hypothetical protein